MSYPKKLLGFANFFIDNNHKDRNLFSAYQSPQDFGLRTVSIITAPTLFILNTVSLLVEASAQLLCAFANLLTFNFENSKEFLIGSFTNLYSTPIMLINALFSPLANLIDLVGGAINTINQLSQARPLYDKHIPSYLPSYLPDDQTPLL